MNEKVYGYSPADIDYAIYCLDRQIIREKQTAEYLFQPMRGRIIASVMFRFHVEGRGKQILGLYSADGKMALRVFCDGMGIIATDGKRKRQIARYVDDTWFSLRILADVSEGNYDLYLDGKQYLERADFAEEVEDIASYRGFPIEGELELQQLFLYADPVQSVREAAKDRPVYDVVEYGIAVDGTENVTKPLQQLIDLCSERGGGILYFSQGVCLSGMVQLKQGVELYIERGAVLKGTTNMEEYPVMTSEKTKNWNMLMQGPQRALIYADNVENIVIQGGGTIDGSGDFAGHYGSEPDRPSAVLLVGCSHACIRNICIKDAGMWTVPLIACDYFYMRDVNICSFWFPNRDAVDLCDCHHVLIENCSFLSDDDVVCLKSGHERGCSDILVRHLMIISTMANGIKLGTYSYGGFRGCTVQDCVVKDTRLCAMCVEIVDGGTALDIVFERIEVSNTGSAFLVVLGNRGNIPNWGKAKIGSIRNVLFSDILIGKLRKTHGSYIGGLYQDGKEYRLENIRFRRVKAWFKGGLKYCPDCPPEYDHPIYPEDSMFGNLPASAYYIRHGDVIFEQCQTEVVEPDVRNVIFLGEGAAIQEVAGSVSEI